MAYLDFQQPFILHAGASGEVIWGGALPGTRRQTESRRLRFMAINTRGTQLPLALREIRILGLKVGDH